MSPRSRARVGRRTPVRLVLASFLALVGLVLVAGPASAHAQLVGTDPALGSVVSTAPKVATLTFDENIRVLPGAVHLYAADGHDLHVTAHTLDDKLLVDLPTSLGHGTYTIGWRIISADGHPIAGTLPFSIGARSARIVTPGATPDSGSHAVDVALAVTQALVYLGLFLTVGLVCFLMLLLPREGGPEGTLDDVRRRLRRVARAGAVLGAVASILLLSITTVHQSGAGFGAIFHGSSWHLDFSTPDPWAALVYLVGIGVAILVPNRIALVGGLAALGSLVLVGHTRSFGPSWLVITTDFVHVIAGSVWFGGLIGLAISLRHLADSPQIAARALNRFSALAAVLLGTVTVTGTILAWRILRHWSGFIHTSFGVSLLVKLGFVALVVALAGLNRYRLLPPILAGTDQTPAEKRSAILRIRKAVRLEGLLLVAVLSVTGVLVDSSPEPGGSTTILASQAPTTDASGTGPGLRVLVHLDPAAVGLNEVSLAIENAAGKPLEPYSPPTLAITHGALDLGDQQLTAHGGGSFHSYVLFPKSGAWTVSVTVRTSTFDSRVIEVPIRIGK
ncbi:MAG: copper resistance protein CopC [Marmoricola sp.]|nr:copper resistance protein CopC [Marmoricola sp.]